MSVPVLVHAVPPPPPDDPRDEAPPLAAAGGRPRKSSTAFRTISEVAEELDVAQHVLRFWESKFPHVRPLKRGGGRRYYRPEDVDLLRRIRSLLYEEGYTIKGAQKLLRARRRGDPPPPSSATGAAEPPAAAAGPPPESRRGLLRGLRGELVEIRALVARLRQELR